MAGFSGIYTKHGNTKLGRGIGTINRLPVATCPGASDACKAMCYAGKRRMKTQHGRYESETITLPAKFPAMVRIHAAGDFDSVEYIEWVIEAVRANPATKFWAYTRSWRLTEGGYNYELLPALETLRSLPNMQLFASMDDSIEEAPPTGWRVAYLEGDQRFKGMKCLEQTGKMPDCKSCKYCFAKPKGNVEFRVH